MMMERLPVWLKQKIPDARTMGAMEALLREKQFHTVCEGAICPNIGACFARGTATFMILGETCTRKCSFCAVTKGIPSIVDEEEPLRIAEVVRLIGLSYVVVTSVTRDDLEDGGAFHFAAVIRALREYDSDIRVEVLIPDFKGSFEALKVVVKALPNVISHNVETVKRLYSGLRPQAAYERSLELLYRVKCVEAGIVTKSGLMLGLGEDREEVLEVMSDLKTRGCDLVTLGQYLRPSRLHRSVARFVPPGEFQDYEKAGEELGFAAVAAAPLVRSSFRAAELYDRINRRESHESLMC